MAVRGKGTSSRPSIGMLGSFTLESEYDIEKRKMAVCTLPEYVQDVRNKKQILPIDVGHKGLQTSQLTN